MALNFPNSPSPDDEYIYNGYKWIYDGTSWICATDTQAVRVSVADASSHFVGDNVEAVLEEIGYSLANIHNPVELSGVYDYLTINAQVITIGQVDLATDVTGELADSHLSSNVPLLDESNVFLVPQLFDDDIWISGDISAFYDLKLATTTSLVWATDTNLYRSAADLLKTDGAFEASGIIYAHKGFQTTGLGYGSAVGITRGQGAVDLQSYRTSSSQVASGIYSVVGGGRNNTAFGAYDAVLSGDTNYVNRYAEGFSTDSPSVIAGGYNNSCTNYAAGIFSGKNHQNRGAASVITGGNNNEIGIAPHAFIGGGIDNVIESYADASVILGGGQCLAASGATYAMVLGGWQCKVYAYNAIAGGAQSYASGIASVSLGQSCSAIGDYSVALGYGCVTTEDYTWAFGRGASPQHSGGMVLAANKSTGATTTTGENQMILRADGGIYFQTTTGVEYADTTPSLHLDGSNSTYLKIDRGSNAYQSVIVLQDAGTNKWIFGQRITSSNDFSLYSYGNTTDVLQIAYSTGYVGIGKNPGVALDIEYASAIVKTRSTTTTNYSAVQAINDNSGHYASLYSFGTAATGTYFGVNRADSGVLLTIAQQLLLGTYNSNALIIGTNNTEAMRIDTSQRVMIGTTSSTSAKLTVVQSSSTGAIPPIYLTQQDSDVAMFGLASPTYSATVDSGYTCVTGNGDGAVVGPKAKSAVDGWAFAGMLKVIVSISGSPSNYYLPFYNVDVIGE